MREGEFGVTPIQRVTCEASSLAEIFSTRSAVSALTTGPSQPRDSDAVANVKTLHSFAKPLDSADNFMAGNQGKFGLGQLAIDNVQIGPAYRTRSDAHEHFVRTGISDRHRTSDKRPARGLEDHRVHEAFSRKRPKIATPAPLLIEENASLFEYSEGVVRGAIRPSREPISAATRTHRALRTVRPSIASSQLFKSSMASM
jgi:hypothetical protein